MSSNNNSLTRENGRSDLIEPIRKNSLYSVLKALENQKKKETLRKVSKNFPFTSAVGRQAKGRLWYLLSFPGNLSSFSSRGGGGIS